MSLKITLYKDCILTRDYKEAFNMRNASNIDTYLATLTKLDIYSGDDVYFTNSGTISVENTGLTAFTSDIYNYMVFESSSSKRYCFIKNITLVNETAIIEYEEDLWSNYSGTLKLRYGTIQYAKRIEGIINPSPEKFLPKEYESNKPLKMEIIDTSEVLKKHYGYIIADVGVYELTGQGEFSNRLSYCCLLGYDDWEIDNEGTPIGSPTTHYDWRIDDDTIRILTQVKAHSSDTSVNVNIGTETANNWRYEIMSYKAIPYDVGYAMFGNVQSSLLRLFTTYPLGFQGRYISNSLARRSHRPVFYILSNIGGDIFNGAPTGLDGTLGMNPTLLSCTKSINADYKINGIMNYSRFIAIKPSGLNITLKWFLLADSTCSSIMLNVNNELIDMSNDFTVKLPLNEQTADITQQQAISRSLADMQSAMGMLHTLSNGSVNMIKNAGMYNAVGFLGSYVETGANMTMQAINRESLNADKFTSSKGISVAQLSIANANIQNGFFLCKIDPDNDGDITNFINKFGYRYNDLYVLDANVFDTLAQDQYVQFSSVAIYGSFSNDIADKLKQILLNGIYLFATSTV